MHSYDTLLFWYRRNAQDDWCSRVVPGDGGYTEPDEAFPSDLALDSLVALLRGEAQLHMHCYRVQDLETAIRMCALVCVCVCVCVCVHESKRPLANIFSLVMNAPHDPNPVPTSLSTTSPLFIMRWRHT